MFCYLSITKVKTMLRQFILSVLCVTAYVSASACTSAIIGPTRTSDGDIIMWKNRDSKNHDTTFRWFEGGKYSYTALVPCYTNMRKSILSGLNSAGLAVMTTHCSNAPKPYVGMAADHDHSLLVEILENCATVDEAERVIENWKRRGFINSILGVIDSCNGAAYFEIKADSHVRYNVSDREEGYDVRANFAFASPEKRGSSVMRYDNANYLISHHQGKFVPQDFIDFSRTYFSVTKGYILRRGEKFPDNNYTIPRYCTVASIVMVTGKNPRMLVINGNPSVGMAIPIWVAQKNDLPKCITTNGLMHTLSREFYDVAFRENEKHKHYFVSDVIMDVLKISVPENDRAVMPKDIGRFNKDMDSEYEKYAKKVRRVLKHGSKKL